MKHTILGLLAAAVLMVPSAFAAKMVCKDTGKEVTKCCCDIKDGKFVCKLDKKTHTKCCCESKYGNPSNRLAGFLNSRAAQSADSVRFANVDSD